MRTESGVTKTVNICNTTFPGNITWASRRYHKLGNLYFRISAV